MIKRKIKLLQRPTTKLLSFFLISCPQEELNTKNRQKYRTFSSILRLNALFLTLGAFFPQKYLNYQKKRFYSLVLGFRDLKKVFSKLFDLVKFLQKVLSGFVVLHKNSPRAKVENLPKIYFFLCEIYMYIYIYIYIYI